MTNLAAYELQKSIDNVLINDATLLSLLGDGINSIVENMKDTLNNSYPVINYATISHSNLDTKNEDINKSTVELMVFSRSQNPKETWDILNKIDSLLNRNTVDVLGYRSLELKREGIVTVNEADREKITYTGTIVFSSIISDIYTGVHGASFCPYIRHIEAYDAQIIPKDGYTKTQYYNTHENITNSTIIRTNPIIRVETPTCLYLTSSAKDQRALLTNYTKQIIESIYLDDANKNLLINDLVLGLYGVKYEYT